MLRYADILEAHMRCSYDLLLPFHGKMKCVQHETIQESLSNTVAASMGGEHYTAINITHKIE